jgi:hypothetical protein
MEFNQVEQRRRATAVEAADTGRKWSRGGVGDTLGDASEEPRKSNQTGGGCRSPRGGSKPHLAGARGGREHLRGSGDGGHGGGMCAWVGNEGMRVWEREMGRRGPLTRATVGWPSRLGQVWIDQLGSAQVAIYSNFVLVKTLENKKIPQTISTIRNS